MSDLVLENGNLIAMNDNTIYRTQILYKTGVLSFSSTAFSTKPLNGLSLNLRKVR